MQDLIAKIQGMPLTKKDAAIADYIVEHLNTIGLQTSTSLAEAIGVSDTSVIRFIRKLGFRGYADFRNSMAARIAEQYDQTQQESLLPSEKFAMTRDRLKQADLINDASGYILDNLEKSFSKLDHQIVDQVVQILLNSRHKFIAGFRGTAACAQYMASRLVLLLPNVTPVIYADASAVEALIDIQKNDCLFLYSFSRYSEINRLLMDIARKNEAKIILMTDRHTAPLTQMADVVIVTQVTGLGFTNSYVAPLSISEVILLAISNREDANCDARINMVDELMKQNKLY